MKTNQILYRVFIISAFVGILGLSIFGISQLLAYLGTGADRSAIFQKDLSRTNYYTPEITWKSTNNPGRPIESETLTRIERDYMDALYFQSVALQTLETNGIDDVYTQKAKQNLVDLIETNTKNATTIEKTTISHTLSLDFYSVDGQLAVLTDEGVATYSRVFLNGVFQFDISESSDFKIVLLLEDGFWKVRHIEKLSGKTIDPMPIETIELTHQLEGINYYPKDSPWDTFGASFSAEIVDADFKIIKDLGLNTIRIFIDYQDFGKADVSKEKVAKLIQLMDLAESNELKVLITLFDFYGDYSVLNWTQTHQHARSIVGAIKKHEALLAWDIKNEPNLDYNTRGTSLVKAWLTAMLETVRKTDSVHPITIGWSNPEAALHLSDKVDFISFHFYNDIKDLSTTIASLEEKTDKVIVLEEFGLSSYRGFWNPLGNSEQDQEGFYDSFYISQKRDSINYLSWTLYDFTKVPNKVAGSYPWRKNKQTSFGLIDASGAKKSAFEIVKNN